MNTKPTAIILNIPCNTAFDRLVASGLQANVRTLTDEMVIMARQREAAPNVDAFRHNGRVDAAGTVRSDTGTPIMNGWEGSNHEAISLHRVIGDITSSGYSLVNVNLVKKEGKQPSLYLRFEEASTDRMFPLWETLTNEITFLMSRFYGKVQIFRNPDGTTTINPSMGVAPTNVPNLKDPRILRMSNTFAFRNVKVHANQPTVKREDPSAYIAPEPERKPRREVAN